MILGAYRDVAMTIGIKKITKDNWLEVDPIIASGVFVRLSLTDGSVQAITANDWTERLLASQIDPVVPEEIREAFQVARGAMLYGAFFYPLFTLGLEQVLRLTEAAARAKASAVGISMSNAKRGYRDYRSILDELLAKKALTKDEHDRWSRMRQMRNLTTHAERQMVLPPGHALGMLNSITEMINGLFEQP
jgi:hypothetical protein